MQVFRHYAMLAATMWLIASGAPANAEEHASDQQVIRARTAAYRQALASDNAKALAAFWTAEGKYVDALGRMFNARDLFTQWAARDATDSSPARDAVDYRSSIRFLTSDVAIEDGTARSDRLLADGAGYTAIWVNRDGVWLLERVQEWDAIASSDDSPLASLQWMIGDWVGRGDEYVVKCSSRWSDNKKFIVRRFTIERDGHAPLRSKQRIGWDPAANRIRSWTFDSDGGIVEGRWQCEGNSWIVKCNGVLPDGTRSSMVNFWVPEGSDRCVLHSSHVVVGKAGMSQSTVEFHRGTDSSPDSP